MFQILKIGKSFILIKNNAKRLENTYKLIWQKRNLPKWEPKLKEINEEKCCRNMKIRKSRYKWPMLKKLHNSIIIGIKKWPNINKRPKKFSKTWSKNIKVKLWNFNNKLISHCLQDQKIPLNWWILEKFKKTLQNKRIIFKLIKYKNKYKFCKEQSSKNGTLTVSIKFETYYNNWETSNKLNCQQ